MRREVVEDLEVKIFDSLLIIVQQDATQSSLFIILHVHSTCFGCQPSNVAKLACPRWREVAAQKI